MVDQTRYKVVGGGGRMSSSDVSHEFREGWAFVQAAYERTGVSLTLHMLLYVSDGETTEDEEEKLRAVLLELDIPKGHLAPKQPICPSRQCL